MTDAHATVFVFYFAIVAAIVFLILNTLRR
jgi:hypothetical protein